MREHTTHFTDCGCFTEMYKRRIVELESDLAEEHQQADKAVDSLRQRIAELEQKYEAVLSLHNDEMHRREQAEAELEHLKARRCENCVNADIVPISELPDHIWCNLLSAAWRKADYCSHWARAEESRG